MARQIHGPPANALNALTPQQVSFLYSLPKAELHAHLNGCIPVSCLQELAARYLSTSTTADPTTNGDSDAAPDKDSIRAGLDVLQRGVELREIHDFFGLFTMIYALTATPENLAYATRAVLTDFLGPSPTSGSNIASQPTPPATEEQEETRRQSKSQRQCAYIELRSTPKTTRWMSKLEYVQTVLSEVERYPASDAALIVSLDRRMTAEEAQECVDVAVQLKESGRRVVGVDLCGSPLAGDMSLFASHFERAKSAELGVTLHIAETEQNTAEDTMQLLSFKPDRLGHATFLNDEAKRFVQEHKIPIEVCLTSNVLCKTAKSLEDHHMNYHYKLNHPIAICTDDTLPFRTSLLGEYALLLAAPPHGLGMSEDAVRLVAQMGMDSRFVALLKECRPSLSSSSSS